MTGPDWKSPKAIRDPDAMKAARARARVCAACGRPPESIHHVIRRKDGDDVPGNLLPLCGDGSRGCHGAVHGNASVVNGERRDEEWTRRRIGEHIVAERPDVIAYVLGKLGGDAGRAYLERRYFLVLRATTPAARSA